MQKILVSSCLIGLPVRYDGSDKPTNESIIRRWREEGRLIHICPELAAGFGTPRPPAEIASGSGPDVLVQRAKVFEDTGCDVTDLYVAGARAALELAMKYGVTVALLTNGSPSCGSSYIYDGSFTGRTTPGFGVTAALLAQHGIEVFSESEIAEADAYLRRNEE